MAVLDDLPITDEAEVRAFLERLPLAVDRDHFTRFVLGFPHGYLRRTSPVEIVRHFALMDSLGSHSCASSLSPERGLWRLWLVARDRSFLLARLSGSLSVFALDIIEAEAFANQSGLVLDTFLFRDEGRRLAEPQERKRLHAYLENVLDGKMNLDEALTAEPGRRRLESLVLHWDDAVVPQRTQLTVQGRDGRGLLYEIARRISSAGCSIDLAHIETPAGEVRDQFVLSVGGGPIDDAVKREVERQILA